MMRFPLPWLALVLVSGPIVLAADPPARPPVVIFLADDLSVTDCSPYGGREIPTPNMARVAADGMTFTRAFVASPSCAPSRAALLTSLDPMRTGAMRNHARPRADVKKWPAYFHDLGYEVVSFGKTAHYAQVTEYGFDQATFFNYHQDGCVDAAVTWLEGRKTDKPLCLLVGTNWPHVPWPPLAEGLPAARTLPPKLVETDATHQAWTRYASAVSHADRDLGKVYDAARKALGPNTLFVFTSDHGSQFPFGKWNGYDSGVRTPLLVAWPGHVAAGSTSGAMVSWLDLLPTCVEAAGGPSPAGISGRSFLPVLQGKATDHRDKVFLTHSADGQMNQYPIRGVRTARWKYLRNLDPTSEHHTHVDRGQANSDGRSYWDSWVEKAKTDPAAAATVDRYHHRPAEELYDVAADPWEQTNLAADPAHAATLAELRAEVDRWMKDQGDQGLATERTLRDHEAQEKAQTKAQNKTKAQAKKKQAAP